MAFSYLTICSEDAPIEISALYILDKEPLHYDMPSLNFKDDFGKEIQSWDNPDFLIEFYQKLIQPNTWVLGHFLKESVESEPDERIDVQYILQNKAALIELFQLAIKAGIFEEPNLQTIV